MAAILLAPPILTGCAVGQHINIDHIPTEQQQDESKNLVSVQVEDKRDYVLKEGRPDYLIGFYRGGFGKAFEVTTLNKVPLKEQIQKDISEELVNLGYKNSKSGKALSIDILQWHFNGYQNAELWYEIKVNVMNRNGDISATDVIKNKVSIKGTVMTGAKGGLERDIPGLYDNMISEMLRNNQVIISALK